MVRYGRGITDDDYASRYEEASMRLNPLAQSIVNRILDSAVGTERSPQQKAFDRAMRVDDWLRKEASKGEKSIVGHVSQYDAKVARMQSLLQTDLRNYGLALRIFRELQDTGTNDADALDSVIAVENLGGALSRSYGGSARKWKSGEYQDAPVMIGGRQFMLGQLFKADNVNPLEDFGVSPDAANAYLGSDEGLASAVGVFVKPVLASGGAGNAQRPPNAGLLNEASSYVAGGGTYDRMKKAFGKDNVVQVLTDVKDRFGDIGGMNRTMEKVLSYAEARRRKNPDDQDAGATAARGFMSVVDRISQDVFFDPSKNKTPDTLSPSERRWALEAALATLGATTESGVEFDFSNQKVRAAVETAASAVNLARSSGYKLHDEVKAAGGDVADEFKRHIRAFLDNDGYEPSTFVSRERDARNALRSVISIAPAIGTVPPVLTGAPGGYDGDASKVTGAVTAFPAAGVLGKRLEGVIMKELSPAIHKGRGLDTAMAAALFDTAPGGGRERLLGAISGEFRKAVPGRGGRVLARQVLVPEIEKSLSSTGATPFEMYRIMEDIATKEGGSKYIAGMSREDAAAAVGAASRWYKVNVPRDGQVRRYHKMLVDHFMDGRYNDPLSGDQAVLRASTVIQQGLELLGDTNDATTFDQYVNGFTNRGVMFTPAPAVFRKGTTEQVRWDRREPGTGRPVFTPEQAGAYEVARDGQYEQLVLPAVGNAGDRIFAIPIGNVNDLRRRPNPAWEADNEANRAVYGLQKKYLADPSKYVIRE